MKKKTNISVQDVRGIRRTPDLILGDKVVKNVSGDIMDANATEELVNDKIAEVIGTAPEILDTLGEIVQELETKADKSDLDEKADKADLEDYVAKDEIEESLEDKDITVNSITAKEINKDLSDALISTIHIDESHSETGSKVVITGDLGKDAESAETNVIKWIRDNSKLYVGRYNTDYNKMLLKPFNGSDTSWESIDGASLYMCLPEFWYKCYNTSYGCDVSFTMKKEYTDDSWNHWDGKTLIACYKAQLAGDSDNVASFDGNNPVLDGVYFESKPNSKPSTKFSQKQGKQIARNMGDGFSLVTYEEHKIMQLLFYAYYGNVDAQAICGAGASVSNWDSNSHINGRVMDRITNLNDTVASNNPACNHFWGLCDWWGNVYEWVDNILILGTPTGDKEEAINVAILDKDGKITRIVTVPYCDGAITKMAWGKYADVIPAAVDDSYDEISDAGYTDYGYVSSDFGNIATRSGGSDDPDGGVGYVNVDYGPDSCIGSRGSRLSYSGEWAITSELEP